MVLATEDRYRTRWSWDTVAWGTHCLNCLATCPYRVFVRDGRVSFEEVAGSFDTIEAGVPDLNPLGCQKGSAWSLQLDSPDRITRPLRRVGARGEGRWEPIEWDEALTEIADGLLDAIELEGPESIIFEETVEGGLLTQAPFLRFASLLGAVTLDANGLVNDFPTGHHITFGKFSCASTIDDTFHSEVVLCWHSNPAYTAIPYFHIVAEARYAGAYVVAIAPDYNATAVLADCYVPVRPGTDAALALAMCQVIIEEGLYEREFVCSQTDLALLVRVDDGRFLRGPDLDASEREDTFFHWIDGPTPARRDSLELGPQLPELEGRWTITTLDGQTVPVTTVFSLLRTQLAAYTPAVVAATCGTSADTIVELARRVAGARTKILEGFNAPKYYHGDLMERSMCLLLALTGNWGRPGTGITGLALAGLDGYFLFPMKTRRGVEETARLLDGIEGAIESIRQQDPTASDEIIGNQLLHMSVVAGTSAPPAFFNYEHAGYRESWNRAEWSDPAMPASFDDHLQDAVQRGWWGGLNRPGKHVDPQVLFAVGTNPLRRARGGRARLLEHLWPNLELVVVVDFRMSTTALHADIVLPAAMQYERPNLQYAISHTFHVGFSDAAVPPRGEAKTEWEIFSRLSERLTERAAERGLVDYLDGRRQVRRLDRLATAFSLDGQFATEEEVIDEWLRDSAEVGTLPASTTLQTLRREGTVRFTGLGMFAPGLSLATDVEPDSVLTAYRWHRELGTPFPTLTRRAQFYVDHPWFLDAGEALPVHKEPPNAGGEYPLVLTSGHSRWTIHSIAMGNRALLGTHRGRPLVVLGTSDATARDVDDGDTVRVHNDHGEFRAMARVSGRIRPGQIAIYNGFEPHSFDGWQGANEVEPGMVKWLHLVGRYGHLRYLPFGWQPVPADRAVRVEVELAEPTRPEVKLAEQAEAEPTRAGDQVDTSEEVG